MKDCHVNVQFCIAHLIRDIKYLCSHYDAAIKNYGRSLLTAVKSMFKVIHHRDNYSSPEAFEEALKKDGKELKCPAQNMAKRFRNNGQAYFEFITTPGI